MYFDSIPSAGPWITDKEVSYVTDAVENGWYGDWSNYIDKFESEFADFIGSRFALSTSSCTGALHIALKALGIGPGDEVLVPECTWIATATCVSYVGAKPVFVDIDPTTWCFSVSDAIRKLTSKTKAVIPVHMYGHPADMPSITKFCNQHGLICLEDAAPGIGSKIDDQLCGSFGLASAFSFQGAKPLVTGEGGMLTTSDENFYDRAYYYWDHARSKEKVLFNTGIGFKYKMSNIQAALGLAQLQRVDEIITKRRQIFFWYKSFIGDQSGFTLNSDESHIYNNFYVPTLLINPEICKFTAKELMHHLSSKNIGNRPFFRCISKMIPDYTWSYTPNADFIAENALNLPAFSTMTEKQVAYVSSVITNFISTY